MFFKLLREALKVKQVRSKILFTIFIVLVFRIGTSITVPWVNANSLNALSGLSFLNMLSLVSGNAMKNFSVFALGVSPYITASIVVQLLQMDLLPKFVEWGKQGEVGRRKLNQATRYIALVLAFVQSIGITAGFNALSGAKLLTVPLTPQVFLVIGGILTAGSMIVTWLGEQITDKGYGNGVSMIIFAGIVASIPDMIKGIYVDYFVNVPSDRLNSSLIFVGILIVAVLLIIYFTTYVQQAEYKIPIQYTKVAQGAPSSSYLPLKINPAGVIPVIFASSITAAPAAILQFVSASGLDWAWVRSAQELLSTTAPTGIALYALLIILFTFFYTFVQINPEKAAENLQKSGAYIHGVRPGKGTEEYMSKLLRRLATVGSLFLGVISILPIVAKDLFGLSEVVAFGGTSLLIIISTGIAYEEEINDVVQICKNAGNNDIALLKCTSSYPAPLNGMNLRTIKDMKERFGVEVGFSDHTLGVTAPVVAVSLGARMIEKHFILDKSVKSVDSAFSLDESEFALMAKCVREAEELMGEISYEVGEKALANRFFSRSLYASADIKKGEIFSYQNIRSVRPGHGLHPKFLKELIGKPSKRDIKFSERITKEDLI